MGEEKQARSAKQQAYGTIDALSADQPFDEIKWRELIDQLAPLGDDDRMDVAFKFLSRFEEELDWHRFRVEQRRLGNLNANEFNPWEAKEVERDESSKSSEFIQMVESLNGEEEKRREELQREYVQQRSVEERFGLTAARLGAILNPISGSTASKWTLRDLLPKEAFPIACQRIAEGDYDHELHLATKHILELLGIENRGCDRILSRYGSIVARQFPSEDTEGYQCYTFRECLARADAYLNDHPTSPTALFWRGELACWEGDRDTARKIACAFWDRSRKLERDDATRIIWLFSNLTLCLPIEIGWLSPDLESENEFSPLLDLESRWTDRQETLGDAFVRQAVASNGIDCDLLRAVQAVQQSDEARDADIERCLAPSLLPPQGWIWLAEQKPVDIWYYYHAWQSAFQTSDAIRHREESFLSSVVMLSAHVANSHNLGNGITLSDTLDRFKEVYPDSDLKSAIEGTLKSVVLVARRAELPHLTVSDGMRIQEANMLINGVLPDSEVVSSDTARFFTLLASNEKQVARSQLIKHLGKQLWSNLHRRTQELLVDGMVHYDRKIMEESDAEFRNALFLFSDGMLEEIYLRFWVPVLRKHESKNELRDAVSNNLSLGGQSRPGWSELIKYIGCQESVPSTNRIASANRVQLQDLPMLLKDLEWLRERIRNPGAHQGRTHRDEAILNFNRLIDTGLVAKVLSAFCGVSRGGEL